MLKLLLPPDQEGYSVEDNDSVVQTKVDGGKPRYRRDYLGASFKVEAQWTLSPDEYQYFRAFYNNANKGADPFILELLIETAEPREYVCHFTPGSWKLNSVKGASFKVKASLEVQPNDQGIDYLAIVTNYTPEPYTAPPPPTDWGIE